MTSQPTVLKPLVLKPLYIYIYICICLCVRLMYALRVYINYLFWNFFNECWKSGQNNNLFFYFFIKNFLKWFINICLEVNVNLYIYIYIYVWGLLHWHMHSSYLIYIYKSRWLNALLSSYDKICLIFNTGYSH